MTEPDRLSPMPAANQIPAGEESQATTGAAGAPRNDGPEYGAMRSQFPKNYDPYQFGRAEEPVKPVQRGGDSTGQEMQNPFAMFGFGQDDQPGRQQGAAQSGQSGQPQQPNRYGPNQGYPGQYPGYGQQGYYPQSPDGRPLPGQPGYEPNYYHGIDLNDPRSNPLYGRWDTSAIVSFVFSLLGLPILPAILGAVSIWRSKTFHMKGRGFAIAAVVIDVILTVVWAWMLINGVTSADVYQMLGSQLYGVGGSGSDSLSA